jgi:hypothetical protein
MNDEERERDTVLTPEQAASAVVMGEHLETPEEAPSMMEELSRMHEEALANKTLDLDVPGYQEKLVVRYNRVDGKQLDVIGQRVRRQYKKDGERLLWGTVDTMIEACEGLYFRRPESEELVPIDPDHRGIPLRYEERLAQVIGFPSDSARDVVHGLFAYNDVAITAHGFRLNRWMSTNESGGEDFLGES